ncbi:MAG TPA: acetyltransferase [Gemmataceae bacterium]|jgi:sugar O-acyltransferase (sialic acid O-acetyltransferase NeuD family)
MDKEKDLVLVGDSAFAEVAYEYFTHDSPYRVAGFSVERAYLKRDRLCGLPVVPFEEVEKHFDPARHCLHVAVVYTQMNRLRERLCREAKAKGYPLASYISSHAFVWRNVVLGEHCFIFEKNVVQPFVTLGNNVVLWSGNHIGHHSTIEDNCFISSHVVISGYARIGANSFLGVNSCVSNNRTLGRDCWIGPGITIAQDVPDGSLFNLEKAVPSKVSSLRFFKIAG